LLNASLVTEVERGGGLVHFERGRIALMRATFKYSDKFMIKSEEYQAGHSIPRI
jgi:hypothetical protein